jgi:hypothetical protein
MTICGMSAFAVAIGGQSGRGLLRRTCLLMTQSGHLSPQAPHH